MYVAEKMPDSEKVEIVSGMQSLHLRSGPNYHYSIKVHLQKDIGGYQEFEVIVDSEDGLSIRNGRLKKLGKLPAIRNESDALGVLFLSEANIPLNDENSDESKYFLNELYLASNKKEAGQVIEGSLDNVSDKDREDILFRSWLQDISLEGLDSLITRKTG
jgi:hypothetical protein